MLKKLIFSSFVLCLCTAQNAWCLLPREYDAFPEKYACPEVEIPPKRSFYFGAFGGTWSSPEEAPIFRDIPRQFYLGGSIGFRFVAPWRIEAEVTYRHSRACLLNVDAWSGMANIFRDFKLLAIRPYLGFGGGYFRADKHFKKFAAQVMTGVTYPIRNRVNIGVEYRYFQPITMALGIHSVGLTCRSLF